MALTVGSLFSGIGGIDLGLERAGMVTRWFCEIDPHCRNVLARHWPSIPIYGDITAIDWAGVEPVDVLAGGFPCQPVSSAGKQAAQADARWLWPEFHRAIRALRPRYVLVENVRNLLAVNGGSAMGEVVGDLAALGYDAEWDCIPAAALGANHERDRLWLVAYPPSGGGSDGTGLSGSPSLVGSIAGASRGSQHGDSPARGSIFRPPAPSSQTALADPTRLQLVTGSEPAGANATGYSSARAVPGRPEARPLLADTEGQRGQVRRATLQRPGRPTGGSVDVADSDDSRRNGWAWDQRTRRWREPSDGGWWATEPDVGRVADGVPHRVDRLRALGNAVVPQVVEWIGRRIVAFDEGRVAA